MRLQNLCVRQSPVWQLDVFNIGSDDIDAR